MFRAPVPMYRHLFAYLEENYERALGEQAVRYLNYWDDPRRPDPDPNRPEDIEQFIAEKRDNLRFYTPGTLPGVSLEDPEGVFDVAMNPWVLDEQQRPLKSVYPGEPSRGVRLPSGGYPWASFLFYQTEDVEFYSSPSGFQYELTFLLHVELFQHRIGAININRHCNTMCPYGDSPNKEDEWGLMDIYGKIIPDLWQNFYCDTAFGKFPILDEPTDDPNWWVLDWTYNIGGEVLDSVREMADTRTRRDGEQMITSRDLRLKFEVFERI